MAISSLYTELRNSETTAQSVVMVIGSNMASVPPTQTSNKKYERLNEEV